METTNITSNTSTNFNCENCDFKCSKRGDYNRHILTPKHARLLEPNGLTSLTTEHPCKCGKIYKHLSSLYKHKKSCALQEPPQENLTELITQLVKANLDLQTMLIEQNEQHQQQHQLQNEQHHQQICEMIPKLGNTINNTTNQTFNLEMFLNVYCKDAMTMDDFVKTIEVTREHMIFSKEHGFVDGLNNIVNEKYNQLPVSERPMHATDKKRDVIYVKNRIEGTDDTEWKRDENKEQSCKMYKVVANKQLTTLTGWHDENIVYQQNMFGPFDPAERGIPDNIATEYLTMLKICLNSVDDNREKFIKNISNMAAIDKGIRGDPFNPP